MIIATEILGTSLKALKELMKAIPRISELLNQGDFDESIEMAIQTDILENDFDILKYKFDSIDRFKIVASTNIDHQLIHQSIISNLKSRSILNLAKIKELFPNYENTILDESYQSIMDCLEHLLNNDDLIQTILLETIFPTLKTMINTNDSFSQKIDLLCFQNLNGRYKLVTKFLKTNNNVNNISQRCSMRIIQSSLNEMDILTIISLERVGKVDFSLNYDFSGAIKSILEDFDQIHILLISKKLPDFKRQMIKYADEENCEENLKIGILKAISNLSLDSLIFYSKNFSKSEKIFKDGKIKELLVRFKRRVRACRNDLTLLSILEDLSPFFKGI
jgi:hypothetical protein